MKYQLLFINTFVEIKKPLIEKSLKKVNYLNFQFSYSRFILML